MDEHKHKFKNTMHLDSCHTFTNTYVCRCGAGLGITIERDFKLDSYSYVWSEGSDCARCRKLESGARRLPITIILSEVGQEPRRIWRPELTRLTRDG